MSNKKGNALIIVLLIVVVAVVGGYFLLKNKPTTPNNNTEPIVANVNDQTTPVTPNDQIEITAPVDPNEITFNEAVQGQIVGAADSAGAQVTMQDNAWYYDLSIGDATSEMVSYPAAFTVTVPGKEVATATAIVTSNNGLVVDTQGPYQQGELFTVAAETGLAVGSYSAVVDVTGTTTDGEAFSATFVAVYEVQ